MSKKKISIVTPNFNGGEYIEQTIDSILSQGYDNLEYIIVDGASTDNSLEIINKYEKYLTHWISEPDRGQSDAINKGLHLCTGDIFNWINSDDYLCPNALNEINLAFNRNIDVLVSSTNIISQGQIERVLAPTDVFHHDLAKTIAIARLNQPGQWWKMSVLRDLNYLNDSLRYVMDLEFWIRYLMNYGAKSIERIDTPTANFRLHEHSKTVAEDVEFKNERNNLYESILSKYKDSKYSREIDLINVHESKNDFIELYKFPAEPTIDLISIYDKFKLLLAEEAYQNFDSDRAKKIIELINSQRLDEEEKMLFVKIKSRLRIPDIFRINLQRGTRKIRSILRTLN